MSAFKITAVSFAATLLFGCMSATVSKSVQYTTTPARAFECAMGAARDIGLMIESSDSEAGTFAATKIGSPSLDPQDMANYQTSFVVDKQTKTVEVDIQSFGQLMPGDEAVAKMTTDFQSAFQKRCM